MAPGSRRSMRNSISAITELPTKVRASVAAVLAPPAGATPPTKDSDPEVRFCASLDVKLLLLATFWFYMVTDTLVCKAAFESPEEDWF